MNPPSPVIPSKLLEHYISLLGIPLRQPSIDALCELVQAHMLRIPFENISKLYYKKHQGLRRLPTLEQYLDGIQQYHFGGTCYSNNYYSNPS
jgi:arylamine N-acetyltransferase